MTATKRTVRKARAAARNVQHVVRTTVGELISTLFDTVGPERARVLLTVDSPLQKMLRQRVVAD